MRFSPRAARAEGVDVGENGPSGEGQRQPEAAYNLPSALPHEVDSEQREDEQAGVAREGTHPQTGAPGLKPALR